MSATIPLNPLNLQSALVTKIDWQYFFGIQATTKKGRLQYMRCYFATINLVRVEKRWISPNNTRYSIGDIDKAKKKFKTESELLQALNA